VEREPVGETAVETISCGSKTARARASTGLGIWLVLGCATVALIFASALGAGIEKGSHMNFQRSGLLAVLGVGLGACLGGPITHSDDRATSALSGVPQYGSKEVCAKTNKPGYGRCMAKVRTKADGVTPFVSATVAGFVPTDLQSAYDIDPTLGTGITVGIVDAFDDPNAEADLAVYRSQFGLPACTTANGCFTKVAQDGSSDLPTSDPDWASEISLDLDMVSAACPNCKIVLVEATDQTIPDFAAAEATAVSLGAAVVSNSWGLPEDPSYSDAAYDTPGVAAFASAGDSGYEVQFPAASPYVHSVGGTSLVQSTTTTRGWVETVWGSTDNSEGGTGSGCSASFPKPSWQTDTGCSFRTVADISAVADPNTGVAVYDSFDGEGGWQVFGGTSAASPLTASIYAMTGHGSDNGSYAYANTGDFNDVTSGSNGSCGSYLCNAQAGYDGPTGVGTPNAGDLASGGSSCTPACSGKSCGSDGCGGNCGTCVTGDTCSASGQCVAPSCTPACSGKSCGSDGCGGTCGTCSGSDTCSSSGSCTAASTCTHDICSTGAKLKKACDPCATEICAKDPYCCKTKWDSVCTGEVNSVCGETCN
jgi:hypothetical protein